MVSSVARNLLTQLGDLFGGGGFCLAKLCMEVDIYSNSVRPRLGRNDDR